MRRRAFLQVAATALCCSTLFLASAAGAPQAQKAQGSAKTPDISGVWFTQGKVRAQFDLGESSPMLPWAQERMKADQQKVSSAVLCIPPGVPRIWTQPYPFEIISLPGRVLIYYEFQHFVRDIRTDGRDHPKDLLPTYMGNSVGKWEGDTLVVDTIGFNDITSLDNVRRPHSDALHVIERIRRRTHDELQLDMTIDDPKAYAKPWSAQRIFDLKPGWEISEQICEDNNTYLFPPDKTK
jgi:hypothetical protein